MPRLRNLLKNPVVHVLADEPRQGAFGEAVLAVDGLVCGLCAARVAQALRNVPGVTEVEFEQRKDVFKVSYSSGTPLGSSLAKAAQSTVIAPRVRNLLGSRRTGKSAAKAGRWQE